LHHFVGTHQDNKDDSIAKNRHAHGEAFRKLLLPTRSKGKKHSLAVKCAYEERPYLRFAKVRGEGHGMAKLTNKQVRKIRKLYATGLYSQKALGGMFGVTQSNICYLTKGKTFTEV
jgi:hypothetical protein